MLLRIECGILGVVSHRKPLLSSPKPGYTGGLLNIQACAPSELSLHCLQVGTCRWSHCLHGISLSPCKQTPENHLIYVTYKVTRCERGWQ